MNIDEQATADAIKGTQRLLGKWITRCCSCGREYENGCGSTECCGSIQEIVWHDPKAVNGIPAKILRAAQRDADALRAILASQ